MFKCKAKIPKIMMIIIIITLFHLDTRTHFLNSHPDYFLSNVLTLLQHYVSLFLAAITLYNEGYDVWLASYRGSNYGRKHLSLSPDDDKFWDFSYVKYLLKHGLFFILICQ